MKTTNIKPTGPLPTPAIVLAYARLCEEAEHFHELAKIEAFKHVMNRSDVGDTLLRARQHELRSDTYKAAALIVRDILQSKEVSRASV